MKILKLLPVIAKNLVLIIIYELKKLRRRSRKARWAMNFIIVVLIIFFGYRIANNYFFDPNSHNLNLSQAARVGKVSTHRLLVELVGSTAPGQYERGDIILIASANSQFTAEERSKFLIINMNLTDKQAEVLLQSLKKSTSDPAETISLKRRKYAVNLGKAGIKNNDRQGRVIEKTYQWNIIYEK